MKPYVCKIFFYNLRVDEWYKSCDICKLFNYILEKMVQLCSVIGCRTGYKSKRNKMKMLLYTFYQRMLKLRKNARMFTKNGKETWNRHQNTWICSEDFISAASKDTNSHRKRKTVISLKTWPKNWCYSIHLSSSI